MATPPATNGGPVIELDEEIDGDEIGSRNYRFSKIGESVPINSEFDPQSLPSQPLSVSERLRLLFVAHPQGFYVSRTKDVMEAAEEIKEKQSGPSLKDLSLVDVLIGKVSILALSADDSLLAVSVDSHVHFFAVSALLHKDQTPSYSVSLDDSSCIKDVRWAKKATRAYLILSDNGKLYHGSGQGPLACVMESVDSVDWSVKGNFVAVAQKSTVIILSSEFKEKLRFLLSFQSVFGHSDVTQVIKVDSIRWIRPDCIAVGCFQLNDDGEEENYIVQVITSSGGRVTDVIESSKPTVLSFSNVFMDFCSDAVPTRNGPHLFLSYLDLYGVAFIANRNLSQQVGLFRWSSDGKNEVAMVEILNDAWTLYIDSQDNDEENVIVGLFVDKVSQNENVKFTLGDVESEVSPCCVIICLTIDGKISVFHFASAAGALEDNASAEEDDASRVLGNHNLPLISSTGGEESKDPTFSMPESHKFIRSEAEKTGAKATITNDVSQSINVDVKPQEQTTTENMGQKPLVYSRAAKGDEPEKTLPLVLNQDINAKNQTLSDSTSVFSGKVIGDFSRQPISSTGGEESKEPTFSMPESHKFIRSEAEKTGAKATITNDVSQSINVDVKPQEQTTTENMGQKPLVYSREAKGDEPEKTLPLGLNQDINAKNQTLSDSTSVFSGKVIGDFSRQPISSTGGEESKEPTFSMPESHKFIRSEAEKTGAKATITNDVSQSINVDVKPQEQTTTENMGQKPLVYSRAAKGDEPEKTLPLVLNQDINAKNQTLSDSTSVFSGKVFGDFSRQPITKDPPSRFNVEPLGKAPPASSPNFWSSAGIGASKPSDGRFSLLPSDVGNSDKHALEPVGQVLRQPTNINEKAKPAASSTSFGLTASTAQGPKPAVTSASHGLTASTAQGPKPAVTSTSHGLTASTAQGRRNSLSAYPISQASLRPSVASGKPFQTEFRKELNSASATDVPKQFGTVEEMAKKLDILLEDIEGKGGFIDASITFQTKSVMELEDGICTLSGRCRTWKGLMNEKLRELQLLLDKTVQALVRKVYMEGVFKQAADTRYWELWNRQKLSSELELKQRHILELNQELTNKLIELERHFNTLELNRFGENGGMQRNRRVLQHSRQTQSLHSLHNTMQAQLAAAEQLSGCLSNQMSALCIESFEKQDVKKKLFESIGLSYVNDTERSPAENRTSRTPLNKEHLITSSSIASKEHSRRNQASLAKSPETARRRRDSLDRSWTSFEPPKTTVKRVLKEDYDQGNANQSLLNFDKQYPSSQSQKKSEFAHSARSNMFRASLNSYKGRGTGETSEQHMESPLTSLHQRTADSLNNGYQVSSTKSSFALPTASIFETRPIQNSGQAAFKLIDEKTKGSPSLDGNNNSFAAGESSSIQKQPDTGFNPLPSISTQSTGQSPISPSVSTETSYHFKLGFTKSTTGDQKKDTSVGSETPLFDFKIPVSPASAFSSVTNVSEKGSLTMTSEKPTWPNDNSAASSIPSQSLFGSSSLFSSNNIPSSFASSESKPISSNSFSTPSLAPSSPSHESNVSSISPSSGIMKPEESLTSLSHPPVDNTPTKTSVDNTPPETEKDVKTQASPSQPAFAISTPDLKLGPSTSSAPTELSTDLNVGSQIDFSGLSKSSSLASVSKTDLSPVARSNEGIIGSLKNVISNSSQEEEMDEEAPETDQTSGLSLGNLGGFGIGSTPNSTTPKPNPFGVTNLNNNISFASSQNMMSIPSSGELFRPASFNFLPPASSQPVQPAAVNFPGGFSSGNSGQAVSGFGQPANIGAGQQALGSVLGSFGQSRQIGTGLPGNNVAPANAFGGGFRGVSPGGFGGGFASAAPSAGGFASLAAGGGGFGSSGVGGGGFSAAANAGGGFAAAATGGGGFGAVATGGGGFGASAMGGGGFGAAATGGGGFGAATTGGGGFGAAGSNPGGGFGAFGNQQGGGGFSAFGGGSGVARPPPELFTQMRK